MKLDLEFRPAILRVGRATYRAAEYALEYATQLPDHGRRGVQAEIAKAVGIREPTWLAIADTLVISFSGQDAELISFDAYTNIDHWTEVNEVALPDVVGAAAACLRQPPEGTDRIDLGMVPGYQYSPVQRRLQIALCGRATEHYQLTTCLFAGVDANGLTSFVIDGLEVG